ncbi:unnamed protein product [Closterium sp. NIES-65]|nr:unnamed protein product [Closterium sp. NIES-65]
MPRQRMGMAVSASMMEYATFAGGAYIFQPSKPAMPITSTNATYQCLESFKSQQVHTSESLLRILKSDIFQPTKPATPVTTKPATPVTTTTNSTHQVPIHIQRGPIVEEFSRQITPWISEVFRVYPGGDYAELHYSVGPLPAKQPNHEVVTRFVSPINSSKAFYSDSNGRSYLKRVVDYRSDWDLNVTDPIAGNYYPLTVGAFIKDKEAQLSVLVDRAAGAASLASGQIEVMLHRKLSSLDGKGVGEPLQERIALGNRTRSLTSTQIHKSPPVSRLKGVGEPLRKSFTPGNRTRSLTVSASFITTLPPNLHPSLPSISQCFCLIPTPQHPPLLLAHFTLFLRPIPCSDERAGEHERRGARGPLIAPLQLVLPRSEERAGEHEGEQGEERVGLGQGSEWRRQHAQRLLTPLQLSFAVETQQSIRAAQGSYTWHYSLSQPSSTSASSTSASSTSSSKPNSASSYSVPPNVAVITMQVTIIVHAGKHCVVL